MMNFTIGFLAGLFLTSAMAFFVLWHIKNDKN